jgi:hypothetical protein
VEPQKGGEKDVLFRPFAAQEQIKGGVTARRSRLPRPVLGCLVVIVAIFLCSGVTMFAADRLCYGALSQRLPLYPDSTVISQTYNLFSAFGMGNTVVSMTTPDDQQTVRNFYGRATSTYMDSRGSGSPFFTLAKGQWDVSRGDNGEGSLIILFGTCIQ